MEPLVRYPRKRAIKAHQHRAAASSQAGVAIVQVALALTVLVGIAGLLLDGGIAFAERRRAQRAADAGALAGAQYCSQMTSFTGQWQTSVRQIAKTYTQYNGYTVPDSAIDVYLTPEQWCKVVVRVNTTVSTFFIHVLNGQRQVAISVLGKGQFYGPGRWLGSGILTLSDSQCPSLAVVDGAKVKVTSSDVNVAADCSSQSPNWPILVDSSGSQLFINPAGTGEITYYTGDPQCLGANNCRPTPVPVSPPPIDPFYNLLGSGLRDLLQRALAANSGQCGYGTSYNRINRSLGTGTVIVGPSDPDGIYLICYHTEPGNDSPGPAIDVRDGGLQTAILRPGIYLIVRTDSNPPPASEVTLGNSTAVDIGPRGQLCVRECSPGNAVREGAVLIFTALKLYDNVSPERVPCGSIKVQGDGRNGANMFLQRRISGDFKGISVFQDPACAPHPPGQGNIYSNYQSFRSTGSPSPWCGNQSTDICVTDSGVFQWDGALYWPRGDLAIVCTNPGIRLGLTIVDQALLLGGTCTGSSNFQVDNLSGDQGPQLGYFLVQ
jgi:Flp pilus assembly protein TadG